MSPAVKLLRLLEGLEQTGRSRSVIDLVRDGQPLAPWRLYRVAHPDRDAFEDRSLEVLSRVEIDVRARARDVVWAVPRC
jgi:hypothetical protein